MREISTNSTHIWDDGPPELDREPTIEADVLKRYMLNAPSRVTVGKVNGLFLSWNIYWGDGELTIDPPLPKPWEDTRISANSPWGALWHPPEQPEDGIWEVTATFDRPGSYVLWGRADDGGLYHDTYVTVHVSE